MYGLIRVEFQWLGATPRWLALACSRSALLSCLGGMLWALVQHDLKRLLAYSSIENVGIIALGARRVDAARRRRRARHGRRSRSRRRCCTSPTTRSSRRCCSSARALSSAPSAVSSLDHLGGLLRRMPWTGGAFLIGSMAIAGLPPLNGFASEWLDAAVAAARRAAPAGRGRARRGRSRSPAWRRRRHSRCCASSRSRGSRCSGRRGAPSVLRRATRRRDARRDGDPRVAVRRARTACRASFCRRSRVSPRTRPASLCRGTLGLILPGTGSYPTLRARARADRPHRCACTACAGPDARRPRRPGRAGSPSCRSCAGPRRRSRSRCGSCCESVLRPERTLEVDRERRDRPERHLRRRGALAPRQRCCTSRRSAPACGAPRRSPAAADRERAHLRRRTCSAS